MYQVPDSGSQFARFQSFDRLTCTNVSHRLHCSRLTALASRDSEAHACRRLSYLCGPEPSAKKFQLQRKIDLVKEKLADTKEQAGVSRCFQMFPGFQVRVYV